MSRLVALCSCFALLTGCFTTRLVTGAPEDRSQQYDDRQWFTLGGLVGLSSAAGRECRNGVSHAESELGGVDILINIGLGLVGGVIGGYACNSGDPYTYGVCVVSTSNFVPWLLSSRTVHYTCAAGGAGGAFPPPSAYPSYPSQGYPPQPAYPPQPGYPPQPAYPPQPGYPPAPPPGDSAVPPPPPPPPVP